MNISAVLLSGGESHRMGRDKAILLFRRRPLWQIQLDRLRKLAPTEIFVSARTDPVWRPGDVQFVADTPPSRGPLSGLAASIAKMRATHLLALGIDMPFMTEKYLRDLCENIVPGCGVLPTTGHLAEPLSAVYPVEAAIEISAALTGPDFSLQALTSRLMKSGKLRPIAITKEQTRLFRNLNDPADLESLQRSC